MNNATPPRVNSKPANELTGRWYRLSAMAQGVRFHLLTDDSSCDKPIQSSS
jgi:hypothetical protein